MQESLFEQQGDLYEQHAAQTVSDAVNPHRLLLASAGTGKTFQLANHFAALLLHGVDPQHILATTFTRKAAGEILDRVLGRLCEAAAGDTDGEKAREHLLESIQRFDPPRRAVTRQECLAVLCKLVRRIDRFQIRTLDAFFVRLARLFSMELEIAPDWRITDEVEEAAIVAEGVARVLEDLESDERLELLRGMTRGAATRRAQSALQDTVEKADAIARDAGPGAWQKLERVDLVTDEEVTAGSVLLESFELPLTKKHTPVKLWVDAVASLREILSGAASEEGPLVVSLDVLKNGLVKKALAHEVKYGAGEIAEDVACALRAIAGRAIESSVDELLRRNLATERFLERYAAQDVALRAERGAYRFGDFPRALEHGPARTGREEWTTELGYRLDARLDHLLLDEFQDTAPSQWRLLLPLVGEVLADGTGERSFFCVGDVKQSVYGWRGGEPRLLSRMAARHDVLKARTESLSKSYRSSAVVLDAVNDAFKGLTDRAALQVPGREAALVAADEWIKSFEEHTTARDDLRGEARLWQVRPHDKSNREGELQPAIWAAVDRVVELHTGRPGASIAVLVRNRKEVPTLRYLLGRRGVEASDEGGNPLTDAVGVTWILGLLHLADHPGDGIAALQVARSPFASSYGIEAGEVGTDAGKLAASRAAERVRESLVRRGYGAFCGQHASDLMDDATEWDARRLEQLVDLALAHDERASLRPIDFVEAVRTRRVSDPAAARVKVMTIHASKGLEFDIVVLPELGRRIRLTPDEYLVDRSSEVDPPALVTACPQKVIADAHETLARLYGDEQQRGMTDALSGLYVGMTRAKHCLEMIVTGPSKKEVPLSPGGIIGEAFGAQLVGDWGDEDDDCKLVWEHGDSTGDWASSAAIAAPKFVEERTPAFQPGSARGDAVRVRRPSGGSERTRGAAALLAAPTRSAARLGTLVHALFEDFEWLDAEARTDDDLRAHLGPLAPDVPGLVDEAVDRYRAALASPGLASLFTRPDGTVRVLAERTFDVEITDTDGDPFRWRGAIDRLVLTLEGGAITHALIVDFKTDAAATGADVVRAHAHQMEAYREAVTALFGLDASAVECALAWVGGPDGGMALPVG